MPRDYIEPNYVANNSLLEGERWSFEIEHIQIRDTHEVARSTRLKLPEKFSASVINAPAKVMQVDGFPNAFRKETHYRIVMEADTGRGLRKDVVVLEAADGGKLLEIPIVTRRVPFLSCTPERIFLGDRPARVFLHCPDANVELTRVMSAPLGIRAVGELKREVTIMVNKPEVESVEGIVKVGTTALDRPPLEIPVIRYSPSRRTEAATQ